MRKTIFLALLLFVSVIGLTRVDAQSTNGFCELDDIDPDQAGDQCGYLPFSEFDITINGQPLTAAQEQMFCQFIGGTYHQDISTIPEECENIVPNVVPEFSTIAATIALTGAGAMFMVLRRRE